MKSPEQARDLAQALVERAVAAGASAADALYAADRSASVDVRLGELENVSRSEGEEIGLCLFVGQRSASVASSDLSNEALATLVERCMAMAKKAPEDSFAGLAPPELLALGEHPALDTDDGREPDVGELRARALEAEKAALAVAGVTNSSGSSASGSRSVMALATSDGFAGAYHSSGHSVSASVIAGEGGSMQRDHAWHSARHLENLEQAAHIGRRAGERAVARVNPTGVRPGTYPVIFDPRVSSTLLGHFASTINGASVARKTSFLRDRLGTRVFAAGVSIVDDPLRPRGLRSRPFDAEGVRVTRRLLVSDGIVESWIAESASARQLGMAPTGNAVRGAGGAPGAAPANLYMEPGARSREELLASVPEAVLIVELIGQGVNGITGDYSRGAAGFMVRGGEIAEPVAEITVAGNLLDMFATLEPASDLELRRGIDAPTLLVPQMVVASS